MCAASAAAPAAQTVPPLLETPHSGWLWSNPFPQGNALSDVAFAGKIGFAVGEEGTVLRSLDGGSSWTTLRSGTMGELSLVQVLDPATVIVGGGGCDVRESTDGGMSFKSVPVQSPQGDCLPKSYVRSFSFLSATSGFIETQEDLLLWTADGGASLQARTPVPLYGASPGPIDFLSPSVGLALVSGENIGRIMRTTDGGRSWSVVYEGHVPLSDITFPTPLIGFAIGTHDTMLRTEDGGASWHTQPLALAPETAVVNLTRIACRSAESCLMVTTPEQGESSNVALRTVDGGRTATTVATVEVPGAKPALAAIAFAQPGDAVAVGSGGASAVSSDDGATFSAQLRRGVRIFNAGEEHQPRLRVGASALEAYVTAERGEMAATSDGGREWRLLALPTHRTVLDVVFPNPHRGFAVVQGGAVYRTDDGGGSWRRCGAESRAPVALLAPSPRIVVLATEQGLWRSTDSCAKFAQLRGTILVESQRRPLSSVNFAFGGAKLTRDRAMLVYGTRYGHYVLESRDAGASWELVSYPPTTAELTDISFLHADVGYEFASGGRIYFTRNRGRSWRQIISMPADNHIDLPAMSFSSERVGYVAARYPYDESGNIIFRTEDAGRTWIPEQLPSGIGDVIAVGDRAYAVQEGFAITYVTTNGGLSGGPSRLTLAISGSATRTSRALARSHGRVTVHGKLIPAVAGAKVHVSFLDAAGDWSGEATTTDAHGVYSFTVNELESTTWFVAHWNGDDVHHGAGTVPVRLTVRR
jgi:photosystem II stability/assembly factor-like uncharacterized protein